MLQSRPHFIAKYIIVCYFMHEMRATDEIDRKILQSLSRNGRLSNVELADQVGLSASACSRRVAELERTGAIQGYRAIIAPEMRDGGLTVLVAVGLAEHTKTAQTAFERAVARTWQVRECHNVAGTVEYMLRVEVPDLAAYKEFHTEILGELAQVRQLTSYIVMGTSKDERG